MTRTKRKKEQQQPAEAVKPKDAESEEDTDEMEVDDDDDDEEQGTPGQGDDDDDDDDDEMNEPIESSTAPPTPRGSSSAFMDSFYGLSSDDPKERAMAGQALLHYSVTGPDANVQDAAYALKRLLNGLCSGRAAARQGNASALTSFLKLTVVAPDDEEGEGKEEQSDADCLLLKIQNDELEKGKEKEESNRKEKVSTLAYVRRRLMEATDPTEGGTTRRKGSEERDYQFGRLFGILAVIRSGILLPTAAAHRTNSDEEDITNIASELVQDLVELYQAKKWMREPAAHAVGTMLTLFYNHDTAASKTTTESGKKKKKSSSTSSSPSASTRIVQHLVEKVIIPKLLVEGDNAAVVEKKKPKNTSSSSCLALFATYSAEQMALALMIQSLYSSTQPPPSPLNVAVLSKETIPLVASALVETSCVVQPRVHLVWDAIFSYLSKEESSSSTASSSVSVRRPVPSLPIGGKEETAHDIMDALIQTVVVKGLLGGGGMERQKEGRSGDDGDKKSSNTQANKATHERRSLALTLVRHMAGVEFVSSITGRTRLRLDAPTIETVVFCPAVVESCFLKVVGAGAGFGGKRPQGDHLLKPLALKVLEMVVESITDDATEADLEECMELRFALFKALIRCDSRFDGRTKTNTVANLVGLKHAASAMVEENETPNTASFMQQCVFWDKYIDFLHGQILLAELPADEGSSSRNTPVTYSTASAFADLLLNLAKYMFRIPSDKDTDAYKSATVRRILSFFMTTAFFDCRNMATTKSKKNQHDSLALQTALNVKEKRSSMLLPYNVRCVLSARFFSLLTEDVHTALQSDLQSSNRAMALDTVGSILDDLASLEEAGASRTEHPGQDDDDDDEEEEEKKPSLKEIVDQLRSQAKTTAAKTSTSDDLGKAQCRFAVGISLLSSILYLHSLSCGRSDDTPDEDGMDVDEAEDFSELKASISDIHDINELFAKGGSAISSDDDADGAAETPLGSLAVLCVNILSSPLVGNVNPTRGSSPKLLREVVQRAWTAGLKLYAASSDKAAMDSEVAGLLLSSIGAPMDEPMETDREEEEDDDMEDKKEQDDEEHSDDEGVFARAANNPDILDDDEDEDDMDTSRDDGDTKGNNKKEEEEEDIELDSERLKAFLEEDSDADVEEGVLEHHEGADAALAKLIKLKQDARKAGQQARERIEIAGNMRCMDLVESLLQGRPDAWGSLLRADIVLGMILPILRRRRQLEKAVASSASGKRSNPILRDKRDLLGRYTTLLHKMRKFKLTSLTWPDSVNAKEFSSELATNILVEANADVSLEHTLCCSDSLIVIMKSIPTFQDKFEVAGEVYGAAISKWATNKRAQLHVSLLDSFVQESFVLAQGALLAPLCSAAKNAASSFLKAECFRLLALLYEPKRNPGSSEMDLEALSRAQKSIDPILETTVELLDDSEFKKAKRAREILKTVEKVLDFKDLRSKTSLNAKGTKKLVAALATLKEECGSPVVAGVCDKISARLHATETVNLSDKPDPDVTKNSEPAAIGDAVTESKKSKKEKKKAKKSKKKR